MPQGREAPTPRTAPSLAVACRWCNYTDRTWLICAFSLAGQRSCSPLGPAPNAHRTLAPTPPPGIATYSPRQSCGSTTSPRSTKRSRRCGRTGCGSGAPTVFRLPATCRCISTTPDSVASKRSATSLWRTWCTSGTSTALTPPRAGDWTMATGSSWSRRTPDSPHRMMLGIPPQDRVLYSLEVRAHPLHAQRRIAPLEGIEDRQVTLVVAFPRPKDVQDEPLLLGKQLSQNIQ